MSVHKTATGYKVRWREGTRNKQRTFDRRADALAWDGEVRRRRQRGALHLLDGGSVCLDEYVKSWAAEHGATLAPKTRQVYTWAYDAHIGPRVGSMPLHAITPSVVARLQSDLLDAGAGHAGTTKALALLSSIMQRAVECELVATNPVRAIRKARPPMREEVRPLAPQSVEALRAVLSARDATIVSVLAYAGLRPGELRTLRWQHVKERTLVVAAPKTGRRRTVPLLAPLRQDLAAWRLLSGRPADRELVFPSATGGQWSDRAFNEWRGRVFGPALERAGLPPARPYDLRHSCASLLIHEGRSVVEVARTLGHSAQVCLNTYAHTMDELTGAPRLDAEQTIRAARVEHAAGTVAA
jgi:integrase